MNSEHTIRLRGGWECEGESPSSSAVGPPTKINLPIDWPEDLRERIRLVRRFGAPPVDAKREHVVLRLAHVAGLVELKLNDLAIATPAGASELELPLDAELAARNVLVLEVEPAHWAGEPGKRLGWGEVALVVRPR